MFKFLNKTKQNKYMYIQSAEERENKITLRQTPASNNGPDLGGILNSCA